MIWMCVGCRHLEADVDIREKLAFSETQAREALKILRQRYPALEVVILSTCNRVEIFAAMELGEELQSEGFPANSDSGCEILLEFLAEFHHVPRELVLKNSFRETGLKVIEHLFTVASSLDSMVVGEGQILGQVKEAYYRAVECHSVSALLNPAFQRAIRVAKRVASQTGIQKRKVSVPSVAVSEFAHRIFEHFEDKKTLVVGAGKMAEETLVYLVQQGVKHITVINRSENRARELAQKFSGQTRDWEELDDAVIWADLIISTTGATLPIMTRKRFEPLEMKRNYRPLFVLDLAVPRDFEPKVGAFPNVYLYTVDDLRNVCQANIAAREKELPRAFTIIKQELEAFLQDIRHHKSGQVIRRLQSEWKKPMQQELQRLFNKIPELNEKQREEVQYSFERLVNKLLHIPLESLHQEAADFASQRGLLDAIQKLFRLK
ncbi:MAG: glutamyl-tRNA reductase [Planctomycetia bacterium]|nr:glutamyl-tRNA reductase [Planctomycetia bacterium]